MEKRVAKKTFAYQPACMLYEELKRCGPINPHETKIAVSRIYASKFLQRAMSGTSGRLPNTSALTIDSIGWCATSSFWNERLPRLPQNPPPLRPLYKLKHQDKLISSDSSNCHCIAACAVLEQRRTRKRPPFPRVCSSVMRSAHNFST